MEVRHWTRVFVVVLIAMAVALSGGDAWAKKKKKRRKRRKRRAPVELTVPVNVGVAPTLFMFYGPVMEDQTFHTGLRFDVFAIINSQTLRKVSHKIPAKYRKMAASAAKGEGIRFSPLWYIPKNLIISPKVKNTGMFGINFMPLSAGLVLTKAPRISVGAGLLLTYNYIYSDTLPSPTHFLRPGIEAKLDVEFPVSKSFHFSVGYSSSFYPPQELGGEVFKWGALDKSIWHVGQMYLMFHFRFPYTTRI